MDKNPNNLAHSSEEQRRLAISLAGEYEITDLIGEGTTGMVFKATQLRLSRVFAIKVLKLSFAQQDKIVKRFLNEAQVAARLRHPNIVNIIDVKQEQRLNYFIMDYIGEQNLEAVLAGQEKIPLKQAIDYAIQICDALHHAHAHNVIHRDIKPSNIVIASSDGRPVLTDFSIAKISQEGSDAGGTVIGTILGTYWYMSPEQFQAKGSVDNRSDIYSFGALLYEMITGCRPFNGETLPELTHAHIHQIPVAPSEWGGTGIPQELDALVLRCLEKPQPMRYQTAVQLKEALLDCRRTLENAQIDPAAKAPDVDHLALGRESMAKGDFQRAIIAFNKVPQHDANYLEATLLQEQANAKLRAQQDSDEAYKEGKAALDRGHIDIAIRLFTRAIVSNPFNDKARAGLKEAKCRRDQKMEIASLITTARKSIEERNNEQVVTVCERILQIDPDHGEALFLKDTAHKAVLIEEKKKELFSQANDRRTRGELEGALNIIRQIKDLDPASTIANQLEQDLLKEIERQKRIQEYLKMAKDQTLREDHEAEIETWSTLINLAPERTDEFSQYKKRAEDAVKKKKRVEMLLFAASECMEKEFWGKAIKICEEILKLNSEHVQAQSMMEQAMGRMEKERKARRLIDDIEAAIRNREFKDAREQLSQLFRIYPGHAKYSVLEEQLRENMLRVGRIKEDLKLIQRYAETFNLTGMIDACDKLKGELIDEDPEHRLFALMKERIGLLDSCFQSFMTSIAAIDLGNTQEAERLLENVLFQRLQQRLPQPAHLDDLAVNEVTRRESQEVNAAPGLDLPPQAASWPADLQNVDIEDEQEDQAPESVPGSVPRAELTENLDESVAAESTSEEAIEEYTEEVEPARLAAAVAPTTITAAVQASDIGATDAIPSEPVVARAKQKPPEPKADKASAPQSSASKFLTSSAATFVLVAVLVAILIVVVRNL